MPYRERHDDWPRIKSGPVEGVPAETWSGINSALQNGRRGLPGGSSLARLVRKFRGQPEYLTNGLATGASVRTLPLWRVYMVPAECVGAGILGVAYAGMNASDLPAKAVSRPSLLQRSVQQTVPPTGGGPTSLRDLSVTVDVRWT